MHRLLIAYCPLESLQNRCKAHQQFYVEKNIQCHFHCSFYVVDILQSANPASLKNHTVKENI